MQTWINDKCDRANWPAGPWDGEPDKAQWKDEKTGLDCLANRHPRSGNWCGYVGLPPGHRLHGKNFQDARRDVPDGEDDYIEVHGGLTFSDECQEADEPCRGICHVAAPGEPDKLWWLGFDCHHGGDEAPGTIKWEQEFNEKHGFPSDEKEYRTLAYVRRECARLAAQLVA